MIEQSPRRKLIEVALPLDAINEASRKEKGPFTRRHPRSLHKWWAPRPLAACRAVLFASLVDDPSARPDVFVTEESQEQERERLLRIVEELAKWENASNSTLLRTANDEIRKTFADRLPVVVDPFAGGGSIPLEAQRLGLEAHASDLNPVACLITKALIEIPPRFAGRDPVNPDATARVRGGWRRASGLAEDIRYYGRWLHDRAKDRLSGLYPPVTVEDGRLIQPEAWLWARVAQCPNPACGIQMPLVGSFWLSTKDESEAWLEPYVEDGRVVTFRIRSGSGSPVAGTVSQRGARCLICETPVPLAYIRDQAQRVGLGMRLLAIVGRSGGKRVFLEPTAEQEEAAQQVPPADVPDGDLPDKALGFRVQNYGFRRWADLFMPRQLVALSALADLVRDARSLCLRDMEEGGQNGEGAEAYAQAVGIYLSLAVSRLADFSNAFVSWHAPNTNLRQVFARQTLSMEWRFAETNVVEGVVDIGTAIGWVASAVEGLPASTPGTVWQLDASEALPIVEGPVSIATDPPYYDNIGYADLSDFFYVWLRRMLVNEMPDVFSTILTPKVQELIADPNRFGGSKNTAKRHFEQGLRKAFGHMRRAQDPRVPMTLFYAFKQAESSGDGVASTGWETMLQGLVDSGFQVTATWPMRTEGATRLRTIGSNALASSVVLACRARPDDAPLASRKEFLGALNAELPAALRHLQRGNVAPVDLAQAAIGPGMAIYSRYARVVEADGGAMSVRAALETINDVLDRILAEQEGDFDPDTRWAVAWFEQHGFNVGPYGEAETLSKAKNTSVQRLVDLGILESRGGKVRLLGRTEFPPSWNPHEVERMTVWLVTQHLVRDLESGGDSAAAELLRMVGGLGESARELAYRLYVICERRKWANDGLALNALVVAWPEIARLANAAVITPEQTTFGG